MQLPNTLPGVGPVIAVKAFFVVSGFYMAMILAGPYRGQRMRFYANRALRLWPIHGAILSFSLLATLVLVPNSLVLSIFVRFDAGPSLVEAPAFLPLAVLIAALNVGILGIQALHFGCFDPDTLVLSLVTPAGRCIGDSSISMLHFTPNPPLWTLGVEVAFYVAAPFLTGRRTSTLIVLIGLVASARLGIYLAGYDYIPWNRSTFVLESIYFLLGILSYRLHRRLERVSIHRTMLTAVCGLFLVLTCAYRPLVSPLGVIVGAAGWLEWAYIAALWGVLPLLFRWSAPYRLDRLIGELSYPAYLSHMLVLAIAAHLAGERLGTILESDPAWIAINITAALAVSLVCVKLVGQPVERLRDRVRQPGIPQQAVGGVPRSMSVPPNVPAA